MAEFNFDTVADAARDAFYVAVGAGVITFQKAQVQRQELTKLAKAQFADAKVTADKSLDAARETAEKSLDIAKDTTEKGFELAKGQLDSINELVEDRVKLVEERLSALEERLEAIFADLEDKLPEQ
ncbi:MAG: hypothetical protein KDB02_14555, partial [Acidimicrobiales bacterium]|nr:hypothetical protein [Acidimicrobiales bacterium]